VAESTPFCPFGAKIEAGSCTVDILVSSILKIQTSENIYFIIASSRLLYNPVMFQKMPQFYLYW
jgi:hypothetical protein